MHRKKRLFIRGALLFTFLHGHVASAQFCTGGDAAIGNPGISDSVRTLAVFDDGTGAALYAGGFFVHAGGTKVCDIAKWTGEESWAAVGGGMMIRSPANRESRFQAGGCSQRGVWL